MIPSRRLVTLYVMTAHVSLALAFALTAWNPYAVAGFFYHSRMVAIVHLITIGWIGMSILGHVYIIMPMTFGVALLARRRDYVASAFVLVGLIGMVAHFWIGEFGGMAWSAATAASGVGFVAARVALRLRRAKVANGVKLHIYFASANAEAAVTMGVLLGFDKVYQFLPGYVLTNVFAHAHLAAIGWVCLMVIGVGYRLLPMALPATTPSGRTTVWSAILIEVGIWGLFASLVARSSFTVVFASFVVAGFGVFVAHALWMLAHPRRPPPGRRSIDVALIHLGAAGACLLLASVCGLMLTALPTTDWTMRLALLYGTLGLVGFLAQVIVGFEQRVLPIAARYWGVRIRPIELARQISAVLWLAGLPAVATGLYLNLPTWLAAGSWMLLIAAVLNGLEPAQLLFAGTRLLPCHVTTAATGRTTR